MTFSNYSDLTILLADDQPLFRKGLKSVIDNLGLKGSILEAQDGKEAIELSRRIPINLFIMDHQMVAVDDYETLRMIFKSNSNAQIIIMTKSSDQVMDLDRIGIKEVVNKNSNVELIERVIKSTLRGSFFYDIVDERLPVDEKLPIRFAKREKELIALLGKGLTSQAIAQNLNLATKTIETYRCRLLKKANVKNTSELLVLAYHATTCN